MHPNFAERLFSSLHRAPAREVLRWPGAGGAPATSWTGADLLARVGAWQQALEAAGPLAVGTPVLLARPASPETVAALLAVLGLGGVPVLPPAGAPARMLARLAWGIRRAGGRRVVTAARPGRGLRLLARLLGLRCVGMARGGAPRLLDFRPPAGALLRAVPGSQPALVSYSSGSISGRPTAVERSHRVLQAQHEALREQFPPWPGQRDLPLFPNVILHNLAVGALSVVPDLGPAGLAGLDGARVLRQLADEQVETLTGNVRYFEALLAAAHVPARPAVREAQPTLEAVGANEAAGRAVSAWDPDQEDQEASANEFPGVRALGMGGSPVPERLLRQLGALFPRATRYVIYGSSEAEPIAVRALPPGSAAAPDPRRGYYVGAPVAGLRLRLAGAAPLWLPEGETALAGEVEVAGAHVARPAGAPGEWLATGDLGYLDAAGGLWLVGRRGPAAGRVRGLSHYQLEHLLRQHPAVAQAAARPTPDGRAFEVFVAGEAATDDLQATLAEAFGPGLVAAIHRRPALPVDGRHLSKIRYDQLR